MNNNKPIRMGFHTGPGGNATGIGEYVRRLDDAGIPATIVAVGTTTGISDVFEVWRSGSPVNHVVCYRTDPKEDQSFSVPNYTLSPTDAAIEFWNKQLSVLPPELEEFKGRVKLIIGNELDKERSDWLGEWGTEIATLANSEGWSVLLFGFSSGEPEPEHWETNGMLRFLNYCEENPLMCGLALHEYSYDDHTLNNGDGWLIGRYKKVYETCDMFGIAYPEIVITEFGYQSVTVPPVTDYIENDHDWLWETYPDYPAAAWWYLGPWKNNLADKVQTYIVPITNQTLTRKIAGDLSFNPTPGPGPDPEPGDCTNLPGYARVPYKRVYNRVSEFATEEQYLEIARIAREQGETVGESADDAGIGLGLGSKTVVEWGDQYNAGEIAAFYRDYGVDEVVFKPLPEDSGVPNDWTGWTWPVRPLHATDWGTTDVWPGGWFASLGFRVWYTNSSTGNESWHPGVDLNNNRPKWDADNGAELYAVANGTITFAGFLNVWGNVIVLRVDDPTMQGRPHWFRYGHNGEMLVKEGDIVKKGQVIATVGRDALGGAAHCHFDCVYTDILESKPWHWPGQDVSVVDEHYLDPGVFLTNVGAEYINPPTPIGNPSLFGLHASADSHNMPGDVTNTALVEPELLKFLSSHDPNHIPALVNAATSGVNDVRDMTFIVRAFLDMKDGRKVTPEQFHERTAGDTFRTVDKLIGLGADINNIQVELHNEPNLIQEGATVSWQNGLEFAIWLRDVHQLFRTDRPELNYMYPGLSPGEEIGGIRQHYADYLAHAALPLGSMDSLGIHTYWSEGYPLEGHPHSGVGPVDDAIRRFPSTKMFITECSHNGKGLIISQTDKANSVLAFWRLLRRRPNVKGIAYFVLSASNPEWQHSETGSGEVLTTTMATRFAER